jgi:hypothetical protein
MPNISFVPNGRILVLVALVAALSVNAFALLLTP